MRFGIFRGRFSPGGPFLLINYLPNRGNKPQDRVRGDIWCGVHQQPGEYGWGNQLRHLRIFIRADADEDRKLWPV